MNSYLGNYIKQMFIKNNVMVETVKAGRFDPRSFNDELIETVQSHVNDQQIRLGKQKSMEVRRRLTDDGVLSGGLRAVGLEYLGRHQYRIKEGYAEIINYVFTQILAYVPYSTIMRNVNSLFEGKFGKHFYESNFYHMARQPLYCGYMRDTKGMIIRCKGLVGEPAISHEQWKKAQEILDAKRGMSCRARFRVLPFSGKLYCGNCGSRMVVIADKNVISYYCKGGDESGEERGMRPVKSACQRRQRKFVQRTAQGPGASSRAWPVRPVPCSGRLCGRQEEDGEAQAGIPGAAGKGRHDN